MKLLEYFPSLMCSILCIGSLMQKINHLISFCEFFYFALSLCSFMICLLCKTSVYNILNWDNISVKSWKLNLAMNACHVTNSCSIFPLGFQTERTSLHRCRKNCPEVTPESGQGYHTGSKVLWSSLPGELIQIRILLLNLHLALNFEQVSNILLYIFRPS